MKHHLWNALGLAALLALVVLIIVAAAHADPAPNAPTTGVFAAGSIAIDTPVIQRPDRLTDRSTEAHACLTLHNALGPVSFVMGGDLQLKPGRDYYGENKYQLGFETSLSGGLTPYFKFERRFSVNDNRFVAGLRWNFDSRG